MIVKVCGMRQRENIDDVVALGIDMIGFIFYSPSSRYVVGGEVVKTDSVKRVGVFVNETIETMVKRAEEYSLDYIQLHGSESVEMCHLIKELNYKLIKAISISTADDFKKAQAYDGEVDVMLFDTKCDGYGGSGVSFDWSMLANYSGSTPFLLSGGITEDDAEAIKRIEHEMFMGVDLNSRFEDAPAVKNIEKLDKFIKEIR
ncbi:MAG: phosphoribosylanthranilate isomerase [Rikenellaceae bacterium]